MKKQCYLIERFLLAQMVNNIPGYKLSIFNRILMYKYNIKFNSVVLERSNSIITKIRFELKSKSHDNYNSEYIEFLIKIVEGNLVFESIEIKDIDNAENVFTMVNVDRHRIIFDTILNIRNIHSKHLLSLLNNSWDI